MDPVERAEAEDFAKWLLDVGDGNAAEPHDPFKVKIPQGTSHPLRCTDFASQNCDYLQPTIHQ
jgi:hypothetical protein